MLSYLLRFLSLIILVTPLHAKAENDPVLIELFTSQGCSSCPPADHFLAEIAGRDDIIALSYHVDYWDRLGWKDTLGSPLYTARQYDYRRAFKNRSVWTPQFVVQGLEYSEQDFRTEVGAFIKNAKARQKVVDVTAQVIGKTLQIELQPRVTGLPEMLVSVVGYSPADEVSIKRGENAGRKITYVNNVTEWANVAEWKGKRAMRVKVPAKINPPFVVLVQAEKTGPVFGTAHVKN